MEFDGSGAYDPDGTIVSYDWDWGDSTTYGSGLTPSHVYAENGVYSATLKVTDSQGIITSSTFTVTVYDAPVIPELEDRTGVSGVEMGFSAEDAYDPDGEIVSYEWDWGDGTDPSTGLTPGHTYAENGVYEVTLTVTDSQGVSTSSTFTVTVYDAPVIPELEDKTGVTGVAIDCDGSDAYDPDGTIVSYDWDWGDGTGHGTGATPSHTYTEKGVYTATLTVTDSQGVTTASTFTVTVYVAPIADAGDDTTGVTTKAIQFDGTGSYDPDGTIVSYDWDWGDGTAHGTGATPTHSFITKNVYTVTLTVTDSDGVTDTDVCVVTVCIAPVAKIATGDFRLFINELGSFSGVGSYDPDGSIVSYEWDWGDGSAQSTTPTATHSWATKGTYTVTLTVTDNDGVSSSTTVEVTVITPCAGLKELFEMLYSMKLKQGIQNSLEATLLHVQDKLCNLEHQNFIVAINGLEAFINEVEAQTGKAITDFQADQLITLTEKIIASIPDV
jgi:PKD repeat protein